MIIVAVVNGMCTRYVVLVYILVGSCPIQGSILLACRVSVETIQEELNEWRKEIDELKEMTSSEEQMLPSDLASQIGDFVPVSAAVLLLMSSHLSFCDD